VLSASLTGTLTAVLPESVVSIVPTPAGLAARCGLDLLCVVLLVFVVYRRRHRDHEMMLALTVLNIGLFATLLSISTGNLSLGAGFGLFGMLSMIRLRSASFTTVDMAYTFMALVLGLVAGIPTSIWWLSPSLAGLLIVVAALADHPRFYRQTTSMEIVLDQVYASMAVIQDDVSARLGTPVVSVTVLDVDYVREITRVRVNVPKVGPAAAVSRPATPRRCADAPDRSAEPGLGQAPVPKGTILPGAPFGDLTRTSS
jgi:Domain of unknown function (DUF4956)